MLTYAAVQHKASVIRKEARMTKRIDPKTLTSTVGTLYPTPYDQPCRARERTKLGDAAGRT